MSNAYFSEMFETGEILCWRGKRLDERIVEHLDLSHVEQTLREKYGN